MMDFEFLKLEFMWSVYFWFVTVLFALSVVRAVLSALSQNTVHDSKNQHGHGQNEQWYFPSTKTKIEKKLDVKANSLYAMSKQSQNFTLSTKFTLISPLSPETALLFDVYTGLSITPLLQLDIPTLVELSLDLALAIGKVGTATLGTREWTLCIIMVIGAWRHDQRDTIPCLSWLRRWELLENLIF